MNGQDYKKARQFYFRHMGNRAYVVLGLKLLDGILDLLGLSLFIPILGVLASGKNAVRLGDMKGFAHFAERLNWADVELSLIEILSWIGLVFLVKGVLRWVSHWTRAKYKIAFRNSVRFELLRNLFSVDYNIYNSLQHARIISALGQEMGTAISVSSSQVDRLLRLFWLIVYSTILVFLSAYFGLFLLVGAMVMFMLVLPYMRRLKDLAKKRIRIRKKMQQQIIQATTHFKYLKITDSAEIYFQNIERLGRRLEMQAFKASQIQGAISTLSEPLRMILLVIVLALSVYVLELDLKVVLVGLVLLGRLYQMVFSAYQARINFVNNYRSLQHVNAFNYKNVRWKEKTGHLRNFEMRSQIQLNGVRFGYLQAVDVIRELDVTIAPCSINAFVGPSGSGKSTAALLIAGLLKPKSGSMFLGKYSYSDLDLGFMRSQIGYVGQDAMIFDDTIYNNVTLWSGNKDDANKSRFWQSIEHAGLLDFVLSLRERENMEVGKNGDRLSGGQRQRLALARELYKESKLLILDEPTSAQDPHLEEDISKRLLELQQDVTIIWITHRLHTVRWAKQISVFSSGQIIQQGTYNELMEEKEGWFAMNAVNT